MTLKYSGSSNRSHSKYSRENTPSRSLQSMCQQIGNNIQLDDSTETEEPLELEEDPNEMDEIEEEEDEMDDSLAEYEKHRMTDSSASELDLDMNQMDKIRIEGASGGGSGVGGHEVHGAATQYTFGHGVGIIANSGHFDNGVNEVNGVEEDVPDNGVNRHFGDNTDKAMTLRVDTMENGHITTAPMSTQQTVTVSPPQRMQLGKIAMPNNRIELRLGVGVPAALQSVIIGADGNNSVNSVNSMGGQTSVNEKHLASSPLIMGSNDAICSFFSHYIPQYFAQNRWLFSSAFQIYQYDDLKNLNFFLYKTLRALDREDSGHPTEQINIKRKGDLDWEPRIDKMASCNLSDTLMTNVITFRSCPRDVIQPQHSLYSNRTENNVPSSGSSLRDRKKSYLLGIIKSTQFINSYHPMDSVVADLRGNGNEQQSVADLRAKAFQSRSSGMMAYSVTYTPRNLNRDLNLTQNSNQHSNPNPNLNANRNSNLLNTSLDLQCTQSNRLELLNLSSIQSGSAKVQEPPQYTPDSEQRQKQEQQHREPPPNGINGHFQNIENGPHSVNVQRQHSDSLDGNYVDADADDDDDGYYENDRDDDIDIDPDDVEFQDDMQRPQDHLEPPRQTAARSESKQLSVDGTNGNQGMNSMDYNEFDEYDDWTPTTRTGCLGCFECFAPRRLRRSLIHQHELKPFRTAMDTVIWTLCWEHGRNVAFCVLFGSICVVAICLRLYLPTSSWSLYTEQLEGDNVDEVMVIMTGRTMLCSMCLLLCTRMLSAMSWLNRHCGKWSVIRFVLDHLLQHRYVDSFVAWFGLCFCCLLHLIFIIFTPFSGTHKMADFQVNSPWNSAILWSSKHRYDFGDTLYLFDVVRICLAAVAMLCLMVSFCGSSWHSHYVTSTEGVWGRCWLWIRTVLCNPSFDVGHHRTRHWRSLRTFSWMLFLLLFYADFNYMGCYSVLSVFVALWIVDRLWFLKCSRNIHQCSNLSIIPLDHQFKVLFLKKELSIEPGDAFYISESALSPWWRSAGFFSKNNGKSVGSIVRVHRKTTFQFNLERVRWNFNFLEQILDAEIGPVFRGPFRRRAYHRLLDGIEDGGNGPDGAPSTALYRRNCIQYLIAVDEGIWYQLEYLNYVQHRGFTKMPSPTHIIFATSSKALFGFIATNLQFLFVEIEGLTVESRLLPSNINLVPNAKEMVQYYKNERMKAVKKRRKNAEKQRQSLRGQTERADVVHSDDEEDGDDEENEDRIQPESGSPQNIDIDFAVDEGHRGNLDDLEREQNGNGNGDGNGVEMEMEMDDDDITESAIMEEMEYDILCYLSIPQILFHHNLKRVYESHPDSKLPRRLSSKYNALDEVMEGPDSPHHDEASAEWLDNAEIEMYFAGIPFVATALQNVCSICRIPFYWQNTF